MQVISRKFRWFLLPLTMGVSTLVHAQGKLGFDRNDYPGDAALRAAKSRFAFTGYWLNNPPGETGNTWVGKRETVRGMGYGFLILWNGKRDAQIKAAAKRGVKPEQLGKREGTAAVAAAKREGFPAGAVIFVDLEEGGRLLEEQRAYALGWTEAVAAAGYTPGAYCSGQPVDEGGGVHITTAEDISTWVKKLKLHEVVLWVWQDTCAPAGPAPGCVLNAPRLSDSGTQNATVWQFAQSPRRPENTASCAKTYATDGECYVPEMPGVHVDLNVSNSSDPSRGR